VWDVKGGEPTALAHANLAEVWDAAFSPDGKTVLTTTSDGKVLVWDPDTGERKQKTPLYTDKSKDVVTSVDFQPGNGSFIAVGTRDKKALVLDAKTGKIAATLIGHTAIVFDVAFNPEGNLVTTASDDGTARVWDWRAKKSIAVLQGHSRALSTAKFSPDGNLIVTASADGTVRVWDWRDRKTLAVIRRHSDAVSSAEFSPDGKWILSAGGRTTKIYACATCGSLESVRDLARRKVKRELTPAERETYLAGR
jgi:WD40 repeat protein